ncbi:MAG: Holliday junction resolvase RuvX [Halobacteriovoraceae bacterium]|nr:Holliday junction resolvase RuvX [Halobacteriovoraceae bacterium]|tara:strand:+ start:10989 stop:11426 length:438 start_codon:yes stop_codon:yes gene_type:complete
MDIRNKRILAIDYGRKVTGVAQFHAGSDPFPIAFGKIIYKSDEQLQSEICKIVEDEFIDILVIGVPYFTDGNESTLTKEIKSFIAQLKSKLQIPVYEEDETLTTFEAEERMKNDPAYNFKIDMKKIDELCAVIILEQFYKNSQNK